ncbi:MULTISPECIES: hypothetical protein [unclassified Myroides]|uniref:hypothetical protein n=1 Tax=unclassified Myroides TaxID=2642485 RepID=UPI0015FA868C|nr:MULTISPECIES: hypothetical protein [unclassified Myroides]MBB1149479.1 hypothetical protein [Myroides sp. NP-2]MDM1406612.1 hypothetical protein [Myroides sp. DF42-4-2]
MNELDLLKKHWNANQNFPKISKDEIKKMIHKKSSSIVMWIFIISVIEFLCLNLASFFLFNEESTDLQEKNNPIFELIVNNIDYLSGFISLVFIFLFYTKYRKICVADSTKNLMKQILQTKRMVNYYIAINISLISILSLFAIISILSSDADTSHSWKYYTYILGLFTFLFLIFFVIIWLYYRVVYGILTKRLMKNYQELEKIEN